MQTNRGYRWKSKQRKNAKTYRIHKKKRIIDNRNKKREDYNRTNEEGYVKNYRALRHKNEPKYRKLHLDNIHPANIKRPTKFSGTLDTNAFHTNNTTTDN